MRITTKWQKNVTCTLLVFLASEFLPVQSINSTIDIGRTSLKVAQGKVTFSFRVGRFPVVHAKLRLYPRRDMHAIHVTAI